MTRDELEALYRRYIASLNERRLDEAESFYWDELLYNGERMSRAEWRARAIEDSFAAMPDFQWSIEKLVIEKDFVAARLRDTATLTREWQGLRPTGRRATFGENVFYRFREGRIDEVWSIADVVALTSPDPG
ncbi:ester cyclase [Hansschlegelia beijingensis]